MQQHNIYAYVGESSPETRLGSDQLVDGDRLPLPKMVNELRQTQKSILWCTCYTSGYVAVRRIFFLLRSGGVPILWIPLYGWILKGYGMSLLLKQM
mmetsp:Transcript_13247/g.32506  ORF Transcript_13247/g.32506 Transcript_13247/m.32506 type:complete len:96 (-) Transcript_13247:150-437(-)